MHKIKEHRALTTCHRTGPVQDLYATAEANLNLDLTGINQSEHVQEIRVPICSFTNQFNYTKEASKDSTFVVEIFAMAITSDAKRSVFEDHSGQVMCLLCGVDIQVSLDCFCLRNDVRLNKKSE